MKLSKKIGKVEEAEKKETVEVKEEEVRLFQAGEITEEV